MAADLIDVEALLAPLDGDAPAGPDLEYDPAFQALEQAAAGKPERQYGDKIYPAEPPDWPAVHEHAAALAARTRDLRVAVWLTRAETQRYGLAGAVRGLQLVLGLLERSWEHVHPQLDADDDNDPTMRLSALLPLFVSGELPADLRAAGVAAVRGALRLRDLELGLGRAEPAAEEAAPTEAGVLQALGELQRSHPEVTETLQAAAAAAAAIDGALQAAVGTRAPDAAELLYLLGTGPAALARLRGEAGEATSESDATNEDGGQAAPMAGAAGAVGALRNRADASRELDRVCLWLERNEPSNPAPLLIRRAQRLMNMSFVDIVREMAPAGLEQVETIVGPREEP
ncbi:MAG: type VI secretion system protein TssA [Burkholderiales bacterium]|nr:type VI secretion system protein TssA [Burkholderiales bacterium]